MAIQVDIYAVIADRFYRWNKRDINVNFFLECIVNLNDRS